MKSLSFLFFFMILISSCDKAPIFKSHVEIQLVNETSFDLYDVVGVNQLNFGFVAANKSSEFKTATDVSENNSRSLSASIKGVTYYNYGDDCLICGTGFNSKPDKLKSGKYQLVVKDFFKEDNTLDIALSKLD